MFRTQNPTLKSRIFEEASGSGVMTLGGTMVKTGLLLLLLIVGAVVGWMSQSIVLLIAGVVGGLILAVMTSFKREWSPVTAPLYAVVEGLAVGTISVVYNANMAKTQYAGAVPLAILGTFVVLGVMLALYATRIIKVTQTFMAVVAGATLAIGITYLFTWIGGMFFKGLFSLPIYQSGPIGIGFSAFVIVLAALNLAMDFQVVESGVQSRAPKYMEWYAGFGLLVTLVWLYLEILRLMSKLAGSRR
ncbi:MAG: Bax inhibitor-1/YccA family protein [Armatimonadetes bacterium]|nr:Bax inhibitor-1/YccA family protein [Armatimonadota bacterium]